MTDEQKRLVKLVLKGVQGYANKGESPTHEDCVIWTECLAGVLRAEFPVFAHRWVNADKINKSQCTIKWAQD